MSFELDKEIPSFFHEDDYVPLRPARFWREAWRGIRRALHAVFIDVTS